jgi:hypothetical protein
MTVLICPEPRVSIPSVDANLEAYTTDLKLTGVG